MIQKLLLAMGSLILLVMCVLLIVFLRGGSPDLELEEPGEPALAMPVALPAAIPEPAPDPAPAPVAPPRPAIKVLPRVVATRPLPSQVTPVLRPPPVDRAASQVAVTRVLKQTPPRMDPRKLQEQTKHLSDMLDEARRSGRWPQERIREVERQLRNLKLNALQHRLSKKGKERERVQRRPRRRLERQPEREPEAREPREETDRRRREEDKAREESDQPPEESDD